MLSFIIIVLVLASLARRPFFRGFPFFLGTRHYYHRPMGGYGMGFRPPMGGFQMGPRPPMGGHHGMGRPHGRF